MAGLIEKSSRPKPSRFYASAVQDTLMWMKKQLTADLWNNRLRHQGLFFPDSRPMTSHCHGRQEQTPDAGNAACAMVIYLNVETERVALMKESLSLKDCVYSVTDTPFFT
jgi:hypothetical protein